jgi:hypothetical protein
MKSILDPAFRYVPAASTDIRKTFRRIRREQQEARQRELVHAKVRELRRKIA